MENSCPIEGRATVIDDAIKGPWKQLRMATMRAARWEVCTVSMNLNDFLHRGDGDFNLIIRRFPGGDALKQQTRPA